MLSRQPALTKVQYHNPGTPATGNTKNKHRNDMAIASSAVQASSMQHRRREHVSLAPKNTRKRKRKRPDCQGLAKHKNKESSKWGKGRAERAGEICGISASGMQCSISSQILGNDEKMIKSGWK